jgi:hypothetical protein
MTRGLAGTVLAVVAVVALIVAFYFVTNLVGVLSNFGVLIPLAGAVGALLAVGYFLGHRRS